MQTEFYAVANKFPNIVYTCYGFFSTAWKESAARILKEEKTNLNITTAFIKMLNFS